jgi:hypothetical protein
MLIVRLGRCAGTSSMVTRRSEVLGRTDAVVDAAEIDDTLIRSIWHAEGLRASSSPGAAHAGFLSTYCFQNACSATGKECSVSTLRGRAESVTADDGCGGRVKCHSSISRSNDWLHKRNIVFQCYSCAARERCWPRCLSPSAAPRTTRSLAKLDWVRLVASHVTEEEDSRVLVRLERIRLGPTYFSRTHGFDGRPDEVVDKRGKKREGY